MAEPTRGPWPPRVVDAPASPIPARESVEAKGRRYLVEGRLVVVEAAPGRVVASCRGTGATHTVAYAGVWSCSCPARGRCCHLVACQLVTSPDVEGIA